MFDAASRSETKNAGLAGLTNKGRLPAVSHLPDRGDQPEQKSTCSRAVTLPAGKLHYEREIKSKMAIDITPLCSTRRTRDRLLIRFSRSSVKIGPFPFSPKICQYSHSIYLFIQFCYIKNIISVRRVYSECITNNVDFAIEFSKRLAALRKERNLTQQTLLSGRSTCCPNSSLGEW